MQSRSVVPDSHHVSEQSALHEVQWAYFRPCLEDRSYGKAVEYSDLKTWWHLFFFQIPVSSSQLPVVRFRLLDIVKNLHKKDFSAMLVVLSLNAVAKENIRVRAKILVNLMLIGSCMWGSQPKHVFHMRHSAADIRYDLSHKSIAHTPNLETLPPKSVKSGRSSVKRASKAYTLRPKRKSKQVWDRVQNTGDWL